jgi:hypothetical protein
MDEMVKRLDEARCGICGTGLGGSRTECRQCETPYHRDCWEYNQGCAIFGCSSRQAGQPAGEAVPISCVGVRTRTAPPINPAPVVTPPVAPQAAPPGTALFVLAGVAMVCAGLFGTLTPHTPESRPAVVEPAPRVVDSGVASRDPATVREFWLP